MQQEKIHGDQFRNTSDPIHGIAINLSIRVGEISAPVMPVEEELVVVGGEDLHGVGVVGVDGAVGGLAGGEGSGELGL